MLRIPDFKIVNITGTYYLQCILINGNIICIEPCYNGFDVGLYDSKLNLLASKECTKSVGIYDIPEALIKALDLANSLLERFTNS